MHFAELQKRATSKKKRHKSSDTITSKIQFYVMAILAIQQNETSSNGKMTEKSDDFLTKISE
jgi:hypothetical protein